MSENKAVYKTAKASPLKVYISGPISGLTVDLAKRTFDQQEELLISAGFIVVNPMNNGLDYASSWGEHMRRDIEMLLDCDAIYMLPNWQQSKGARLEYIIAMQLGFAIIIN